MTWQRRSSFCRQQLKAGSETTADNTQRRSFFVRSKTCGYFKERQIIVGVAKHGKSLAEHRKQDDTSGPNVDRGCLVGDLQQHLRRSKALGAAAVDTVTNLLLLVFAVL